MSKQSDHLLVPGQPTRLTIDAYRPGTDGQSTPAVLMETIVVDDAGAMGQLVELLNGLTPREPPRPLRHLPVTGARDLLHFVYPDGGQRTIKVARDAYRSVSVKGLPGSWSTTQPVLATIDMLLPATFREDLGNPIAYPPSEHPEYISEDEAIAIALCGASRLPPAAEHPSAYAGLMTRGETGRFDPSLGANNYGPHPARKVWLVSVHGEAQTRGGPATPPRTVHGIPW